MRSVWLYYLLTYYIIIIIIIYYSPQRQSLEKGVCDSVCLSVCLSHDKNKTAETETNKRGRDGSFITTPSPRPLINGQNSNGQDQSHMVKKIQKPAVSYALYWVPSL